MHAEFGAPGIEISAATADPKSKAEAAECGWTFPAGYSLVFSRMQELGLYMSESGRRRKTDRPFGEPALFVINPESATQIIDISNAPFA